MGQAGWGLTGAALATTMGNLVGAMVLILALRTRGKVWVHEQGGILQHLRSTPFLHFPVRFHQLRPSFGFPVLEDVRALGKTMAPLSVTYIAKVILITQLQQSFNF